MVKRYTHDELDMMPCEDGEYVRHEDYAALLSKSQGILLLAQASQEKLDAVEAELKDMKATMETVASCDACPVCAEIAGNHLCLGASAQS
jgi:hypothetical protein